MEKAAKTYRLHLNVFAFRRSCEIHGFGICFDICCNGRLCGYEVGLTQTGEPHFTYSVFALSLIALYVCARCTMHIPRTCALWPACLSIQHRLRSRKAARLHIPLKNLAPEHQGDFNPHENRTLRSVTNFRHNTHR